MKKSIWKKIAAMTLAVLMVMSLAACDNSDKQTGGGGSGGGIEVGDDNPGGNNGISEDSPYRDKGFDLSKHETVVMYTSSWCNYSSEVVNGGFKELTHEFLQKYMPYSYPVQAPISWEQVSVAGKIYTIPKNNATFNNYNVFVVRTDLLDKYGDFEINSWNSMKQALITLAENERANGIYTNGQRGTAEFADHLWWQNVGAEPLASGYAFMYYTHGNEDLPDWDKDVFYKFICDDTLQLYKEMAEMVKAGVWSPDRINDTTDAVDNFKSGKVASLILVVGGIDGTHYIMTEDGFRQDGPDAANYNWGVWAWGITGKNSPASYNPDPRQNKFAEICEPKEYAPLASTFTFDKTNVEAELAVIDGIVGEYEQSFNLGLFGDDTELKYNEMVQRLKDAGIDAIMEECRTQYEAFCESHK